jgi:hypothetical protein
VQGHLPISGTFSLAGKSERTKIECTDIIATEAIGIKTESNHSTFHFKWQEKPLGVREYILVVVCAIVCLNDGCASGDFVSANFDLFISGTSGKRCETTHAHRLVSDMFQQSEETELHLSDMQKKHIHQVFHLIVVQRLCFAQHTDQFIEHAILNVWIACQKVDHPREHCNHIVKIWPSVKKKTGVWSRNENHDK